MAFDTVLSGLVLQHFRQHSSLTLQFPTQSTVITGPNASGKTTIFEALVMLSTGNSFRAGKVEEMILFDTELARCKAKVLHEGESDEVEVIVTRGVVQGKRTQHRLFSLNGVKKRKKDAIGKFFTVLFRPEDMRLIEGSPARRRNYLDAPLSVLHREYAASLKTYEQTLKRRNKLLQQVREGEQPRASLQYWNMSLIKHGTVLQRYRKEFLGTFSQVAFPVNFSVHYNVSVISEERIQTYLHKEIAAGHTLIGPHKDDISIDITIDREMDISRYGSRGQQRLAVLWLKYCELSYIQKTSGQKPVLLLDDIMSELDTESQSVVLNTIARYQSIITSTDPSVAALVIQHLSEKAVTLHTFTKT